MKDGTLLAGTESGVFASADGGTTWTVRRGGMIGPEVRAVLAAPGAPVFAGAWNYDGIVASTDRGRTWSSIPSGLPAGEDVIGLAFGPGTHSEVFAATAFDGLFRSSDGGGSWTRAGFARTRRWAVASKC